MVTEKWAGLCFANRNGRIDYTGFVGTSQEFHQYCKDLFLYYWEQANPINRVRIRKETY
jgi:predicted transcriptional regulator